MHAQDYLRGQIHEGDSINMGRYITQVRPVTILKNSVHGAKGFISAVQILSMQRTDSTHPPKMELYHAINALWGKLYFINEDNVI